MKTPAPFKRILIAVDHEDLAANAMVRGLGLARAFGSSVRAVHAVPPPPAPIAMVDPVSMSAQHARFLERRRGEVLQGLERALGEAGCGPEHDPEDILRIAPGHPVQVILRTTDEMQADLIVLGHRAKRSLLELGSTARAVLSRATVPVWTQVQPATPVVSLLIPVDCSENSKRALETGLALAKSLGASVRVMHCHPPFEFRYDDRSSPALAEVIEKQRENAHEQFTRWLKDFGSRVAEVTRIFVEGDVTTKIVECSKKDDLIVMGTHGRTGLARFLLGSVAYRTLQRAERPLLVVPNPEQTWLLEADGNEAERPAPAHATS